MAQNFIANGDSGLSARNIINNNFTELYIGYSTVTVTDIIADKTFANVDTNKVFHFSTSSPLTAIFPSTLSDGFSVAIMNTGTSTLHLSTNGTYKAIGDVITDQYEGAYVYKANSEIFAVGGL